MSQVVRFVRVKENPNLRAGIAEEEVTGVCASIMDRKGNWEKKITDGL
jgi:hypothetical protein